MAYTSNPNTKEANLFQGQPCLQSEFQTGLHWKTLSLKTNKTKNNNKVLLSTHKPHTLYTDLLRELSLPFLSSIPLPYLFSPIHAAASLGNSDPRPHAVPTALSQSQGFLIPRLIQGTHPPWVPSQVSVPSPSVFL